MKTQGMSGRQDFLKRQHNYVLSQETHFKYEAQKVFAWESWHGFINIRPGRLQAKEYDQI